MSPVEPAPFDGTESADESSRSSIAGALLPKRPREFRGQRALKIGLRAVHVLCAGTLLGAYTFAVDASARGEWLLATIVSGAALLAFDLFETSAFLLQVRGIVVLAKIAAVCALPSSESGARPLLTAVVLVSVVMSHAPSKVRYFMVFGRGRVVGSESKG